MSAKSTFHVPVQGGTALEPALEFFINPSAASIIYPPPGKIISTHVPIIEFIVIDLPIKKLT